MTHWRYIDGESPESDAPTEGAEYGVTLSFVIHAETRERAEEAANEYRDILSKATADGVFIEDVCKAD